MNQSFDAGRWWLLVGKHWSENRKKYTLSLIAIAGLLLLWFIVMLSTDGYHGINASMQSSTYYFGLFIGGCMYASVLFADLGSKTRGLNYLTVPASHFEKLLCSLFYGVVVFFVCYTAIFFVVDILMVKAMNAVAYGHWIKGHASGDVFVPQKIFNVFYQPEHSRVSNDLVYLLLGYFVLQAAFIAGSVYFAKFSFIKTVISLLLIGLFIAFFIGKVIVPILPPGNYYHGITSYQVLTYKNMPGNGIVIYSDAATDKLITLPEWIGDVLLFLLKFAFAPLLWVAAYYRLKEKEI
ncbi:MAG: hypothetical protein ABJB86_01105 [Bacteroidota bacterium]